MDAHLEIGMAQAIFHKESQPHSHREVIINLSISVLLCLLDSDAFLAIELPIIALIHP